MIEYIVLSSLNEDPAEAAWRAWLTPRPTYDQRWKPWHVNFATSPYGDPGVMVWSGEIPFTIDGSVSAAIAADLETVAKTPLRHPAR